MKLYVLRMSQSSLHQTGQRKELRIEKFLKEMDAIIPWDELTKAIKPYYQESLRGRTRYGLEKMLRIHFLQLWHNLSDPGTEEALHDRLSFQRFVGFDCFGGVVPDESAILRFRHWLQKHGLTQKLLKTINHHLSKQGLVFRSGTIVDATLMQAPVSKKNIHKQRDPEMSSTKKNNKWYFGAKAHIDVQAQGKPLIHSVEFSTAKDHDKIHMTTLVHGDEKAIFGDSAYGKQEEKRGARHMGLFYGIADRGARAHPLSLSQKKKNRKHSSLRAKVEHPFKVIKEQWKHRKLRYKGLAKNASQFTMLAALCNIYMVRKSLLAMA